LYGRGPYLARDLSPAALRSRSALAMPPANSTLWKHLQNSPPHNPMAGAGRPPSLIASSKAFVCLWRGSSSKTSTRGSIENVPEASLWQIGKVYIHVDPRPPLWNRDNRKYRIVSYLYINALRMYQAQLCISIPFQFQY